ncbi:hypothetical protein QBC43DRAFT_333496 [Cladorrhinum sp. PSN259]|nr:hypothetical protein QBC43DRAFT_333496 [Cladorrhinum sp. PSN259]
MSSSTIFTQHEAPLPQNSNTYTCKLSSFSSIEQDNDEHNFSRHPTRRYRPINRPFTCTELIPETNLICNKTYTRRHNLKRHKLKRHAAPAPAAPSAEAAQALVAPAQTSSAQTTLQAEPQTETPSQAQAQVKAQVHGAAQVSRLRWLHAQAGTEPQYPEVPAPYPTRDGAGFHHQSELYAHGLAPFPVKVPTAELEHFSYEGSPFSRFSRDYLKFEEACSSSQEEDYHNHYYMYNFQNNDDWYYQQILKRRQQQQLPLHQQQQQQQPLLTTVCPQELTYTSRHYALPASYQPDLLNLKHEPVDGVSVLLSGVNDRLLAGSRNHLTTEDPKIDKDTEDTNVAAFLGLGYDPLSLAFGVNVDGQNNNNNSNNEFENIWASAFLEKLAEVIDNPVDFGINNFGGMAEGDHELVTARSGVWRSGVPVVDDC